MFALSLVPQEIGLDFGEQTEEWAFFSQLGRIFDAFSELESITPQSGQSDVNYLFPNCQVKQEVQGSAMMAMNDTVAQLLMPFVSSRMEAAGLLRRTYRWDDPLLSSFSNRATLAAMARSKASRDARLNALAA
ncbi:MAG TPA: hypothetical protein VJU83_06990 [Burkholderiales bacterium]|nr:hypothetical protein [Burkholderiales bacterium]